MDVLQSMDLYRKHMFEITFLYTAFTLNTISLSIGEKSLSFPHRITTDTTSLSCVLIMQHVLWFYNASPESVCDGMN